MEKNLWKFRISQVLLILALTVLVVISQGCAPQPPQSSPQNGELGLVSTQSTFVPFGNISMRGNHILMGQGNITNVTAICFGNNTNCQTTPGGGSTDTNLSGEAVTGDVTGTLLGPLTVSDDSHLHNASNVTSGTFTPGSYTFNISSGTFKVFGTGGDNELVIDGASGQIGLGTAPQDDIGFHLDTPSRGITSNTDYDRLFVDNGGALSIASGSSDVVTSTRINEPNINEAGGTVTTAVTLLLQGAPTEGDNNYGLFVNGSGIRFSGLTSCDTIDTDANGVLSCGTDDAGAVSYDLNITDGSNGTSISDAEVLALLGGGDVTVSRTADTNYTISVTDTTDDTVNGSELDGVFSTNGLLRRTGAETYDTVTEANLNVNSSDYWDSLNTTTDITSLGTVTTGTWQATTIVDTYVADTLTVDGSSSVNLSSLLQTSASTGEVLKWDGSKYAPAVDDDVPESGDFGNAADLESTGALSTGVVADNEVDYTQVTFEDLSGDITADSVTSTGNVDAQSNITTQQSDFHNFGTGCIYHNSTHLRVLGNCSQR